MRRAAARVGWRLASQPQRRGDAATIMPDPRRSQITTGQQRRPNSGTPQTTATVDRLLHHAHIVLTERTSLRLAEATAGKGVVPLT